MIEEGDPIAGGFLDGRVPSAGYALVLLLDVSNTIAEGARDFFGAVCRSVVDDKNFMRRVGLVQGAFEGFAEGAFRVIGGYRDADLCRHELRKTCLSRTFAMSF